MLRAFEMFSFRLRVLCLTLLAVGLTPATSMAEPFRPTDDAQVLERLPAPSDATKRELRRLRAELSRNPENLLLATRLARRYIRLSRAEFDPRYNGYAQAALLPWWNLEKPPAEVLVLRATLHQNRHDFDEALADLSKVLSADPRNAQAWLTRAVILQVQGKYQEAVQSCLRLKASRAGQLVTTSCLSSAASLNGKAAQSYQLLNQALTRSPNVDERIQLWALTILADIAARTGEHEAAERHFRQAFSLGLKDAYLLGAYADFLLDQGRAEEARDLLADETRADGSLLRLALAEQRLGASQMTEHVETLRARFAASRRRGDSIHRREEARFTLLLLKQPDEALRLAKANWKVQREPWDARLVLEAALAAKAPSEAEPVLEWLKQSRLEDVQIQSLVQQFRGVSR